MAKSLVDSLADEWKPEKYTDRLRRSLEETGGKAKGAKRARRRTKPARAKKPRERRRVA